MTDIVETVARAIDGAITPNTTKVDGTREVILKHVDGWVDITAIAVAAIEAYEKAKREAAEPYVTRVEKGVAYWSNGLRSQGEPGSKEFAEAQIKEKFDEQPGVLRDWKERP